MYSHELQEMVKGAIVEKFGDSIVVKNGVVSSIDYAMHFNASASSQIASLKYDPFNNTFEMHTKDNWHFEGFAVQP